MAKYKWFLGEYLEGSDKKNNKRHWGEFCEVFAQTKDAPQKGKYNQ